VALMCMMLSSMRILMWIKIPFKNKGVRHFKEEQVIEICGQRVLSASAGFDKKLDRRRKLLSCFLRIC